MKPDYVVGFKSLAGTIAVSHYCFEKEISMWRGMGYIVWKR
jgi:hypothetical protein